MRRQRYKKYRRNYIISVILIFALFNFMILTSWFVGINISLWFKFALDLLIVFLADRSIKSLVVTKTKVELDRK